MNLMNWLIIILALGALLWLVLGRRARQKRIRGGAQAAAAAISADAARNDSSAQLFTQAMPAAGSPAAETHAAVPPAATPQFTAETAVSVTGAQEPAPAGTRQASSDPDAALLREVFTTRLQALAATLRLKLESLQDKPEAEEEIHLARKQLGLINARTASLDAAYQEELASHEESARFLARLAGNNPASQAAQIRQVLLHDGSAREAEDFLDQFSQEPQIKLTLAAQAAVLSGRLAERRLDLPLALGRYSRALRAFPDNVEYLRLAGALAHLLEQYDAAVRWQQSRVRLIDRQPGRSEVDLALAERDLAYTCLKAGRFDQAATLYKSAMTALSEELGNNHPEMAQGWFQLGEMQESQGAYDKAQALYRRTLDILESNLGRLDLQLGPVLNKLAALTMDMRLEKEALGHYQHLAAIEERYLPPEHPFLAATWAALARAYLQRKEYALAEQYYLKSLAANENLHGREHPAVADLMKELSLLCRQQGRPEEADRYYREAEAIRARLNRGRAGDTAPQDAGLPAAS